jgi:hypothetical protein
MVVGLIESPESKLQEALTTSSRRLYRAGSKRASSRACRAAERDQAFCLSIVGRGSLGDGLKIAKIFLRTPVARRDASGA